MASAALRHPIRVRLLEAMHIYGEVSATRFVNEGWGKDLDALRGKPPLLQVSDVTYHLRELAKAKCVTVARVEPNRGGKEKFYVAKAVAYFSDEEWARLPLQRRREITRVVSQSLIVQIEGAILADTFDSQLNRWLLWEPMKLDEAGWSEMSAAILDFYGRVERIRDDAGERLEAVDNAEPIAGAEKAKPIWTTFGVELFESPELPERPKPDAPDDRR